TSRTVTVSRGSGDPDITIQRGSTLTFPANTTGPQTVTLAAAEDSDTTNGARTIIVSSSGLTSVNVTATEQDNDVTEQALVVNPTSVAVPEGGTRSEERRVGKAGTTRRTVAHSHGSGDPDITIQSGSTLTFPANASGPQTVAPAAHAYSHPTNGARTIIVSSSGLASVNVTATEQDNDIADQALVVNPTSVAVPEGGTNTFAVSLAGQPQSNVVVTSPAGSGDTDITIQSGATLTFTPTNWNVTQN